jgi:putative heme-binding domain-containing protein
VAGGGPNVAPDLEGIGASSPLDYLVYSVLDPYKDVREGFAAVTLLTSDGQVHTGILKTQTPEATVIVNATTRSQERIAADDIEATAPAPSIMPKGLVDNMTRSEFVDLVRFLHELGRPGPFATPNVPILRTWRVLDPVPAEVVNMSRDGAAARLLGDSRLAWRPAYSQTSGALPLDELGGGTAGFARAQLDVGTAGRLRLAINSPAGVSLWVDGRPAKVSESTEIDVETGVRTLLFRVDREARQGEGLRVMVEQAADSPARARVVNGL